MRATALLLVLAAGAVGQGGLRKPLFGQTEGDSNKCGAACEWYASAPVDGNADATCGNRVQYLIEDEGKDAITACGQVATEAPKICGGCACGESCPWDASAPVAEDPGATCGSRVAYLMNQEKEDAATACGKIATEEPEKCGRCSSTPTPPSTCTPALVIMRHAEDGSPEKYDLPGANTICDAACPKALRNNLKPTGEDRRKLIAAQLDNWVTKQLGLCPITAITTIDPSNGQGCPPYGDKGGSTVNPFWTIATWANDHCAQLDADLNYYVHDDDLGTDDDARPVAGSPSIGPGRDGTTSRALTYTSQGLWSRCTEKGCKWDRPKPDKGTLIREAYAGSASEICPPTHEIVWVLTGYDGNQWTKLEQYIMPGVTCQGNCPLAKQTSRTPGIPGYCK